MADLAKRIMMEITMNKAVGIHNGADTHHQLQSIVFVSFRTKKAMKSNWQKLGRHENFNTVFSEFMIFTSYSIIRKLGMQLTQPNTMGCVLCGVCHYYRLR